MDLVFLSTQGWEEMGGVGRPLHYLAREALQRGHRVLFVEVVASQNSAPRENFRLLNFGELGYGEHALRRAWFGLDPHVDARETFTRALDAFETPGAERVVVYGDPFVPFVEWFSLFRARGYKIVYDALDDFDAFPEIGLYFANAPAEKFLVASADLVIAVSTTLVEKVSQYEPHAPTHLLRQGFDAHTFRDTPSSDDAPTSRSTVPSPALTLGFWGHVNAFNVDMALVEALARARPEWTIQLIGPIDLDPHLPRVAERLRALPNVTLVGPVPHEELPRSLKAFDVALVPFPDNAFNRARDPLKVFEYLSGYKPVVASNTPQLANMPYVYLADTPQEFLDAVECAATIPVDHAAVDAYLKDSTWAARFDRLLEWIAQVTPSAGQPVFEAAEWYADARLPENAREYIAHTEELLQERTAYLCALESDAAAKQTYIERLQQSNPLWYVKRFIERR